ncbi:hypothetical protein DRW07_05980 [Alteromonas sediminis]|uniref:Cellobiose phosphorylase n=1 Tax=Alteromonas sediminis TaxID=2259342 RepID=A0A3N5ZBP1_9ALTE|nr:hypothetical protein [Alteromonas sediminis]RPJ67088.1 hypothetical protein DRW07_05980 [Alteromonas sediminis]
MTDSLHIKTSGTFTSINGESFYKIEHVDQMPPFFISLISDQDHWLFAASNGGVTMGRVSPDTAVFPYITVDKIYESTPHSGPKTLIRKHGHNGQSQLWQPFNPEHSSEYACSQHLYKSALGNVLRFEEINHDLGLTFAYTWRFSEQFGLCRICELVNNNEDDVQLEFLDGLQNVLPAGTPRFTQTQSSNLVDAYKWTEMDPHNKLALYTLYSAITDRAEPVEALRATTIFCTGIPDATVSLDSQAVTLFKSGATINAMTSSRGVRGAYLVNHSVTLAAGEQQSWTLVVDVEQDQADIVSLQQALASPDTVQKDLDASYEKGSDNLARIMAASDGFQTTGEPEVALHHYANTLFNVLRGGIFADQYSITKSDIIKTIKHFNKYVFEANKVRLNSLPDVFDLSRLDAVAKESGDPQLQRLLSEYLPITFGRRHGDPSRPWNQFAIELKDELGAPLLSYQGNWRDIFQNWEALALSYPAFIDAVIAKFVNASTIDGYNPYRITKQGIDWEVEEPDDPWSYIGYWGDHQIIYLLKLLELSDKFWPGQLSELLNAERYCYANVPYRIKDYEQIVKNPKDTVLFDEQLAHLIDQRVADMGADGKLILNSNNAVYQVNLFEKLLVPLLTKLSNLVIDGGIWLNTQRPEWNDANNALVGQGLSMVTLYYTNRYLDFMIKLLEREHEQGNTHYQLTQQVATWLQETTDILADAATQLTDKRVSSELQHSVLQRLGQSASKFRQSVYSASPQLTKVSTDISAAIALCKQATTLIQHSIEYNLEKDGLYHAYNTLTVDDNSLNVKHLYPMLEGQVAALSSGALSAEQALPVLQSLFSSDMYRDDQKTFMLYPDRKQASFLSKNCIPSDRVQSIDLITTMLKAGDTRLIKQDAKGHYRFNSDIANAGVLAEKYASIAEDYPSLANAETLAELQEIFESVFNHNAFTGRSGGMFGFEGLGCIYWHMVSKLLLAAQECVIDSMQNRCMDDVTQALGDYYYRIREGIGFNKTPEEYGAFPTDPYSHTPKHAGAQQPGMTGQVKEELLTRLNELGCFVEEGAVTFNPFLLRQQEFVTSQTDFEYLDVNGDWQKLTLEPGSLAFTWCQVPIIYRLHEGSSGLTAQVDTVDRGTINAEHGKLDVETSKALFLRNNTIKKITVSVPTAHLFKQSA